MKQSKNTTARRQMVYLNVGVFPVCFRYYELPAVWITQQGYVTDELYHISFVPKINSLLPI